MRYTIYAIIIILLALAVYTLETGIFKRNPSESDAIRALNEHNQNLFKVTRLHKTNGEPMEMWGIKMYRLFYEAEVVCTRVNAGSLEGSWMGLALGAAPVACHSVGEKLPMTGEVIFRKTENGWVFQQSN